jgi:hypothetical protein
MAILPTKLVSATFLPTIFFVIIVGKKDIRKDKICKHFPLLFNQKPKHFNLPLQALPTKGNSSKNAKKKKDNVDKREVLQARAI